MVCVFFAVVFKDFFGFGITLYDLGKLMSNSDSQKVYLS